MNELHNFVKKIITSHPNITCRKLYGLDAFYQSENPFIVVTKEERVAIFVKDQELLKKHNYLEGWKLNGKTMTNWYLIPSTFNKKKNKMGPILELGLSALQAPKRKTTKNKKKKKKKVAVPQPTVQVAPRGFLERIKSFFNK